MQGMTNKEYFFYEWLIIEKKVTSEKFKTLTKSDFSKLKTEFEEVWKKTWEFIRR